MRGLSEVSRKLFASPPPPPPVPPSPPKKIHHDLIEARQLDELHGLHIPVLDMRLLNAIINKRLAVLKREHGLKKLALLVRYTTRLAAYNPQKWHRISQGYKARLSDMTRLGAVLTAA